MTEVWVCVSWSSDGYHPDAMLDSVHATKTGAIKSARAKGYRHYKRWEHERTDTFMLIADEDDFDFEDHWMEITRMEVSDG